MRIIDNFIPAIYFPCMLKISKTFKYKMLPTREQSEVLSQWVGCCRYLYNSALEHRIYMYERGVRVSEFDQSNELKVIKRTKGLEFFKLVPAQCLQQTLKRLNRAYQNFFRGAGFPKYRKKGDGDSVHFPTPSHFEIEKLNKNKAQIKLPKLGSIAFRMSRPVEGRVRNATVIREGGIWFLSVNCEVELPFQANMGPAIGIDLGVAQTVTVAKANAANATVFELPGKVKEIENRISVLQKRLRHKKRFSKNWIKAQKQIRGLHKKLTRIRHDFCHKVSHQLAKSHSLIVMEDLKVKNMSKSAAGTVEKPGKSVRAKSGLNRSILRQGWYQFRLFCEYKTQWYGSELKLVDPKYSSQTCSECGHKAPENRKSQAEFLCKVCGYSENADLNAAKIILTRGQRGRVCGEVPIRELDEAETSLAI